MIAFWNRREVFVANSLQLFNEIRNDLIAHGINYDYRTFSSQNSRANFNANLIDIDYLNTYYVYVHKNDYDAAVAAINSRSN